MDSSTLPADQLAAPARRAQAGAGITRLDDLARFSEKEIAGLNGIGPNALNTLRNAMAAAGLAFAATDDSR